MVNAQIGARGAMSDKPDYATTLRYYNSFMEWLRVMNPMEAMRFAQGIIDKDEGAALIREWSETITNKENREA